MVTSYIRCTTRISLGSYFIPLAYKYCIAFDVCSTLRLFADDSIHYREIKSTSDQIQLQNDLQKVFDWTSKWQMCFNATKCEFLQITKKFSH
ncbi:hypothetical protein HOLleu_15519 [Holothuria leucospilota]|uniref:Reverse transcriptase domain-containing protein n=1 Tax=Holothuria leucospilota TaxID=206669 RepID=A0A9Q1C9V3_HOLLE|nr:hypothetical protein HOLleu_15519 [Holothuria leucospilota]